MADMRVSVVWLPRQTRQELFQFRGVTGNALHVRYSIGREPSTLVQAFVLKLLCLTLCCRRATLRAV
eukprot:1590219-Amphidinium_carterae.1